MHTQASVTPSSVQVWNYSPVQKLLLSEASDNNTKRCPPMNELNSKRMESVYVVC